MTHYHNLGGWRSQDKHAPHTTKEDVEAVVKGAYSGAVVCTTGAGQEYMDPILAECGFSQAAEFLNPGHAQTAVKLWVKVIHPVK